MDVALALSQLIPSPRFGGSLTDNTEEAYSLISWEDSRPKPSWQDLLNVKIPLSPVEVKEKLVEIAKGLPLNTQAQLAAPLLAPVYMALERGSLELAKLLIENYNFPDELQSARIAALEIFGE